MTENAIKRIIGRCHGNRCQKRLNLFILFMCTQRPFTSQVISRIYFLTFASYIEKLPEITLKYLINVKPLTFSHKIQTKIFTWPNMLFLCSIGYIDAPNKGIEQACSWASCYIYISPFSIIYTKPLKSNVLLVLVLNCMMHKSSYCKRSII